MLNLDPKTEKFPAWLCAIGIFWLLLLLTFPISHNDIWWHLKCGEWFWQHRSFPEHDPFSYSSPDTVWLKASWLFNVLAWKVYEWGAVGGLIAAKLAIALLTGICAFYSSRRRGGSPGMTLGLLALAFLATRFNWTERPQSVANLLFVAALPLLDSPRSFKRLLGLVVLGALWSNINPSAVLLPAFAVAFSAGLYLEGRGFDWRAPVACFCGTLLSPQWGADYLDVLHLFGHQQAMRQMVTEWKAPVFAEQPALAALFALMPLTLLQAWRLKKWSVILIMIPAALGAWRVGRMAPFFAFPSAIFGAALLSPVFSRSSPKLAGLLGLALAGHGAYISSADRLWGKLLDETQFPVQAAEFLAKERPLGNLGNLYRDGSYLLFRLGPQTKVFIDSREIIYPSRVFQAALALESGAPVWKRVVHDFGFSCMLLPRRSRLFEPMLSDNAWKLVYFDKDFAVVATEGEWRRHEGRWPWYEGTDLIQMALNKPSHATTLALERRPADAQGCYLLSLAYLHEGKIDLAKSTVQKSLAFDPDQPLVRELNARLAAHPTK